MIMPRNLNRDDGKVGLHVRISKELHEKLAAAADERVVGVNLLVTKAIEFYLAHLTPVSQFVRTVPDE
jgi:predicted HicB family RNase H-like nuclease